MKLALYARKRGAGKWDLRVEAWADDFSAKMMGFWRFLMKRTGEWEARVIRHSQPPVSLTPVQMDSFRQE